MKRVLLLIILFSAFYSNAQVTFSIDLDRAIGSEWGVGLVNPESFKVAPIPASGAEQTWDFSFIGDEDNGNYVLFSDAETPEDFLFSGSFVPLSDLPRVGGGTVEDDFPNATGCFLTRFLDFDRSGTILDQSDDDVFIIGSVEEVSGEFTSLEVQAEQLNSIFDFPEQLEEYFVTLDTIVAINTNLGTLDSIIVFDSLTNIGFGTLNMYYGDVENVLLISQISSNRIISRDLTTGSFVSLSVNRTASYSFFQSENLLQIITYSFPVDENGMAVTEAPSIQVAVPFFPVPNSANGPIQIPIELSLSPNPVKNQGLVSFQLDSPALINLELISVDGKLVLNKDLGELGIEPQKVSLNLPDNLSTGMYLLKLSSPNGQSGVTKVMIE